MSHLVHKEGSPPGDSFGGGESGARRKNGNLPSALARVGVIETPWGIHSVRLDFSSGTGTVRLL